ncbi:hypothetical protein FB451DRAFT_1273654 [Mycena latifolia]|nr:hypothetical protein FB451DRAFT_1273654 [Mycena latifolia]
MILLTELRPLVIQWLKSVSLRRMANSLYGADSPWAADTDLLPPGFPCPHPSNLVLAQRRRPGAFSSGTAPHSPCPHCTPADTNLGVFEIPPEVCDDPLRPFTITAHLVLEGMLKSVAAHRTVGLMSRVATHSVGGIDYLVKHFELVALPERIPIRQIAARWVKQCLYCATILAHPGPAGCAAHWPPPTIPIQTGLQIHITRAYLCLSRELASRLLNAFIG